MAWFTRHGNGKMYYRYECQHDAHVIRFRSYQWAYMAREYRMAGEQFE